MWPFDRERRRNRRYSVLWEARLHCRFSGFEEAVPTSVVDVGVRGARLHVRRLQVGPYHLVVSNDVLEMLELEILSGETSFRAPVEIRWCNWVESERAFAAGVEFVGLSKDDMSTLRQMIGDLPPI